MHEYSHHHVNCYKLTINLVSAVNSWSNTGGIIKRGRHLCDQENRITVYYSYRILQKGIKYCPEFIKKPNQASLSQETERRIGMLHFALMNLYYILLKLDCC